jgi:hypothetical protein
VFIGIAGLEKMILAFCIGDRILSDIIQWEVDMLDFFSERENIVRGSKLGRRRIEL